MRTGRILHTGAHSPSRPSLPPLSWAATFAPFRAVYMPSNRKVRLTTARCAHTRKSAPMHWALYTRCVREVMLTCFYPAYHASRVRAFSYNYTYLRVDSLRPQSPAAAASAAASSTPTNQTTTTTTTPTTQRTKPILLVYCP